MFLAKSFPWFQAPRRGLMLAVALLGLLLAPACGGSSGGAPAAVVQPPVIQGFNQTSQYPGQPLNILGTGFTGADQVLFGTTQALTFTVVNDSTINTTVPLSLASSLAAATGTAVPVSVHTPGGTVMSSVTLDLLPLPPVPVVTAPDTPSGGPGKIVTLTGSSFTTVIGVSFGGVPADPATIQVVDDNTLTVQIPAGASGAGLITVINPGGSGNSNGDFTVNNAPIVASFLPNPGSPGLPLVLTGARFTGVSAVLFAGAAPGSTVAGTILSSTATQITVQVPVAAVSGAITVQTPHGSVSTAPSLFVVQNAVLALADFNPKQGPEGTPVTLSGTDLGLVIGVAFGGVPAGPVVTLAADGSSMTVKVPPGAGSGPVVVQTVAGVATVPGGSFNVTSPPVSVSGFSSSVAGGVQSVTITGANLGLVTGVSFAGGVDSSATAVSADGTSLTLPVPAGAITGPLSVLTAGGPLPVPGGALNVVTSASGTVITGFNPPQGVPGTEVTLAGSGFTGAQVTYAGAALDPVRFNVDSDTQIRVRVPDDAQASAAIGVTTPAGGPPALAPFTLLPSRAAVLPQPFVKEGGVFGVGEWLNFPTRRRAAMYEDRRLPQAPVFHAYQPTGDGPGNPDGNRDPGVPYTQYTLNLQLPSAPFFEVLPADLKVQLQALGIVPANLDLFVVSQSYQYDGVTPQNGIYELRPHYWTDPLAPVSGVYFQLHNLQGGIYDAAPGVTLSGNPSGTFFNFAVISSHCPGTLAAPVSGPVVASGDSEPIAGFNVDASDGLWSLVYELPPPPPQPITPQMGRAAVTLHLLFSDGDEGELDDLAANVNTFQQLVVGLATTPELSASRGVQMLLALGRPVVNTVTQSPLAGGANKLVVLTGSGLSGPVVVLDGNPVDPAAVQAISDAIVNVTLPLGTAGAIQVGDVLGISDPVALTP